MSNEITPCGWRDMQHNCISPVRRTTVKCEHNGAAHACAYNCSKRFCWCDKEVTTAEIRHGRPHCTTCGGILGVSPKRAQELVDQIVGARPDAECDTCGIPMKYHGYSCGEDLRAMSEDCYADDAPDADEFRDGLKRALIIIDGLQDALKREHDRLLSVASLTLEFLRKSPLVKKSGDEADGLVMVAFISELEDIIAGRTASEVSTDSSAAV